MNSFKINKKNIVMWIFFCSIFFVLSTSVSFAENATIDASKQRLTQSFATFFLDYKFYLSVFLAIGVTTSMLAFIYNITRLGAIGCVSNPQERTRVITNLLITGGCTMAFGGSGVLIAVFYSTVLLN